VGVSASKSIGRKGFGEREKCFSISVIIVNAMLSLHDSDDRLACISECMSNAFITCFLAAFRIDDFTLYPFFSYVIVTRKDRMNNYLINFLGLVPGFLFLLLLDPSSGVSGSS